ncbi:MAG: SCP2 sterol-binding domain-containing protein [Rhodobacteraceae bacterium]|nr:SCP2 sterol-binding domain-containing protein [Paracoccaceae bacterium]
MSDQPAAFRPFETNFDMDSALALLRSTTDGGDADCTVSLDLETMNDLISGDLDPTAAFMQGKIKVDGDMSVAMKLSSIL